MKLTFRFMFYIWAALCLCSAHAQMDDLIKAITSTAAGLWQSKTINFLGNECQATVRPVIRGFRFRYRGKFWCPGLAPYTGSSVTKGIAGAYIDSQKEFVKKAVNNKLFTREEVAHWL